MLQALDKWGNEMNQKTIEMENEWNDSWDDFPVLCRQCGTIQQPPSSSGDSPVFNCVRCGVLLKTPTNIEKTFWYAESGIQRMAQNISSFFGSPITHTIPATVPAGKKAGDEHFLKFRGKTYKVLIPTGLSEGDFFRINVDVTDDPPPKPFPCKVAIIGKGAGIAGATPIPVSPDEVEAESRTVTEAQEPSEKEVAKTDEPIASS